MTISSLSWGTTSGIGTYQDRKAENAQAAAIAAQLLQLANGASTSSSDGGSSPAITVSGPAKNSLYAQLGSGTETGSPAAGGGKAAAFMENLSSLLSALASGDTNAATEAANNLQEAIDGLTATATSKTDESASNRGDLSGFLTDVQSLLSAVQSGDSNAIQSAATTLAENMTHAIHSGAHRGPPPPPAGGEEGQSVASALDTLLSALEGGDSNDIGDAASTLQSALDDLNQTTGATTEAASGGGRTGFISDVQDLLDAVKSGDDDAISSAAATLAEDMSNAMRAGPPTGPPMGPPPPPPGGEATATSADKTTVETSLETALQTLSDLISTSNGSSDEASTSQTAFLDSLKNLFEAMKSGSNVDGRLMDIIAAYAENGATANA